MLLKMLWHCVVISFVISSRASLIIAGLLVGPNTGALLKSTKYLGSSSPQNISTDDKTIESNTLIQLANELKTVINGLRDTVMPNNVTIRTNHSSFISDPVIFNISKHQIKNNTAKNTVNNTRNVFNISMEIPQEPITDAANSSEVTVENTVIISSDLTIKGVHLHATIKNETVNNYTLKGVLSEEVVTNRVALLKDITFSNRVQRNSTINENETKASSNSSGQVDGALQMLSNNASKILPGLSDANDIISDLSKSEVESNGQLVDVFFTKYYVIAVILLVAIGLFVVVLAIYKYRKLKRRPSRLKLHYFNMQNHSEEEDLHQE